MRFYLASWVGDGTFGNEFVVDVDASWAATDLRADVSRREGWALVATPERLRGQGVVDLGDDLDGGSPAMRRAVESALGVTVDQTTLRAVIAELLILHGQSDLPNRTRWKRLRVDRRGHHLIRYRPPGSDPIVVFDGPALVNATVQESFNKADSDTLGPDQTWTEFSDSDWDVESNQAVVGTTGASSLGAHYARADADLSGDDNYTQFELIAVVPGGSGVNNASSICRVSSSAATGYAFKRRHDGTTADYRLERIDAGSVTALTSFAAQAVSLPETIKVQADGSTITGHIDDTEKASTTDSNITSGVRGGIAGFLRSGSASLVGEVTIGDFETGDLGVGPEPEEISGTTQTDTRTEAALNTTISLTGDTQTGTRTDLEADTTVSLSLRSATETRTDAELDTAVSVSGDSRTDTRTECAITTTPRLLCRSHTQTRTNAALDMAVALDGFRTATATRTELAFTTGEEFFWRKNTVGFTKNKVGFSKVGAGDTPPW